MERQTDREMKREREREEGESGETDRQTER